MRPKITLILILIGAFIVRLYPLWWDDGMHFHPDERMLIMVADRIHFFSQLDPDFFNYGSFPIYLLKGVSQFLSSLLQSNIATYDGMLAVGRGISAATDLTTCLMIYLIGKKLNKNISFASLACFLYAMSFFPVQNSHFFVVDVFLTLFVTTLVYFLIKHLHNPSIKHVMYIAVISGACLATKVSSLLFLPAAGLVSILPTVLARKWIQSTAYGLIWVLTTGLSFFICMPYALMRWERFLSDVMAQIRMNSDPYVFPYTLQYVGTTAYIYYLKNVFWWGLGPVIGMCAVTGIFFLILFILQRHKTNGLSSRHVTRTNLLIPLTLAGVYGIYFVVIGKSAVKFMRYMLPLYPLFALIAAYGMIRMKKYLAIRTPLSAHILHHTIIALSLCWIYIMMQIYTLPNTRIQATEWIKNNISVGSTLAVEHWDDRVPVFDDGRYQYVEMTLYELPDDEYKWQILEEKLQRTDYIILASNRLYTPLQRLNNCETYRVCYPKTAQYYRDLFAGRRGFVQVAEFTSYPRLRLGKHILTIKDDDADESFTVYDHPKIMIFKKQ